MFLSWHHWHFNWKRKQIRDQKGLWVTSFFRQLGFALIHVFSIVFIFEMGRSYFLGGGVSNGLIFLLLYLIGLFLTVNLSIIWVANNIIRRIGYRKSIGISLVFTSLGFLCLALADITQSLTFIYITSVLKGLGISHYWVTYYTLFTDDTSNEHIGSSFGLLDAFAKLGQIIAPLIGAALAVFFGFKFLFLFGILFLILSGIPMFFLKHHLHLDEVSWKELFSWSSEPRFLRLTLALGGRNIHEKLRTIVWPVYVFLLIGTIEGMGLFQSIVLLSATIFTFIVAIFFDKKSDKRIQFLGVVGNICFWISRLFVNTLTQIVVIDSADRLFETFSRTYFFGYLFRRAKGRESFSFVVYWIFWDSFWFIGALISLIAILIVFGISAFWLALVALGILGSLLSLLIQEHK